MKYIYIIMALAVACVLGMTLYVEAETIGDGKQSVTATTSGLPVTVVYNNKSNNFTEPIRYTVDDSSTAFEIRDTNDVLIAEYTLDASGRFVFNAYYTNGNMFFRARAGGQQLEMWGSNGNRRVNLDADDYFALSDSDGNDTLRHYTETKTTEIYQGKISGLGTNDLTMDSGQLSGTNGTFWTDTGGTNYWLLFTQP